MNEYTDQSLQYSRFLYKDVKFWYENADTKAQILLTLAGAFITFLTSSVFVKSDDLIEITNHITPFIWVILFTMMVTVTLSVICGLACLWSRIPIHGYAWVEPDEGSIDAEDNSPISGRQVGFFALLIRFNMQRFKSHFSKMALSDEVDIRLEQTYCFSSNVYKKHFYLDLGFIFAVATLILFLSAGALYIENVAR